MPPTSLSLFGVEKSYKRGSRPVIFEIADQVGNDGGTTIWDCARLLLAPQSGIVLRSLSSYPNLGIVLALAGCAFPSSSPEGPLQKTVFVLSHSGFFVSISFAQASLAQIWVQKNRMICIIRFSAVRGGFEPPEPLRVRQFSKLLVSATHPPHREWSAKIGGIR